MAKMFYTLQEAAAKLGVDEQAVKEMAANGQLQQFRDRDKLMFKCEQVDNFAAKGSSSDTDAGSSSTGTAAGSSTSTGSAIPLADSGDTDAIDLSADTASGQSRSQTGMNVFETGEVKAVDPMAQTQVTSSDSSGSGSIEAGLESVGSGSGLLDLTQESDDTSLGAELLDEIYPGADESQAGGESSISGSAVFEGVNMETSEQPSAGLSGLGEETAVEPVGAPATYQATASDAAGNGFGTGMLIGATAALIIGLIVTISALADMHSQVTTLMSRSATSLAIWCGGLLVLSLVLGFIGSLIGKAATH